MENAYHFKRALAALEEDRTLIQWYGWESQEKLVSFLHSRTLKSVRLSARKLTARKIASTEANRFLKLYHVQGAGRGQSHCYGLYDGSELVAVATFGRGRFNSKASWEFLRYAVARERIVHGGSGRLFDLFKAEVNPDSVVSYIDFSHTTRKELFLNSMGFVEGKPTGPSVIWHRVRDNKVVKQTSLLSVGADRLLKTNYGSRDECGLDNRGIMLKEGFLPVHAAGNRVFLWRDTGFGNA